MPNRNNAVKIRRRFCVFRRGVISFITNTRRTPKTAIDSNSVKKGKPSFGTPIAIKKEVVVSTP